MTKITKMNRNEHNRTFWQLQEPNPLFFIDMGPKTTKNIFLL